MISESIFLIVIIVVLLCVSLWLLLEEVWDLALFSTKSPQKEVKNLSTLRALSLFEHHGDITAIDVRPTAHFERQHLPESISAPYTDDYLDTANLGGLDPEKPILIYCDGGYRSRQAVPSLVDAGFKRVFHLNRGMLMWRLFGGPTESTPSSEHTSAN